MSPLPRITSLVAFAPFLFLTALPLDASSIAERLAVSRERAASALSPAPTAGEQSAPRVASNGDASFVVWTDRRGTTDVYGVRLDRDGKAVDERAILVARNTGALAVIWNGSDFAVFLYDWTVVFVSPEGVVSAPKALPLTNAYQFVTTGGSGADARVLYVARSFAPAVMILNGKGDPAVPAFQLTTPPDVWPRYVSGGAGDGEFLILRSFSPVFNQPVPVLQPAPVLAERITFDGRLLSSNVSTLPFTDIESVGIAGAGDGYLVVKQSWVDGGEVAALRLDRNGVYRGESVKLFPADPEDRRMSCCYRPVVISNGNGYTVAWHTASQNGHAFTWIADVPLSVTTAAARRLYDWVGITNGVAIAKHGSRTEIITSAWLLGSATGSDIFSQRVDSGVTPPQLLTKAAPLQRTVSTASGINGSLVVWTETGADSWTYVYARRFASDGTPQDPQPIAVARYPFNFSSPPQPRVNALANTAGDTYIVAWSEASASGRRLNARTGEWIDREPFTISSSWLQDFSLASSRDGALAAWSSSCEGPARCVEARPIAWSGDPLPRPATRVAREGGYHYDVSVASNGTDYMLAWSAGQRECFILCALSPFDLAVARVRNDGTLIDPTPLIVEQRKGYPVRPTIVWDGGRYVIAWSDGRQVRAARVAAEGAVLESGADGRGLVVDEGTESSSAKPQLLAYGGEVLLFTQTAQTSPRFSATWRVASILNSEPLSALRTAPRSLLVDEADDPASLHASAGPAGVIVAYDRRSGAGAGYVSRVFLRAAGISPPQRRRAAGDSQLVPPCVAPAPFHESAHFVPGSYIVDLRDGTNFRQEAERLAAEYGFTLRSVFDAVLGGFAAELSATAVASLRCEPLVEAIYRNEVFSLTGTAASGVRGPLADSASPIPGPTALVSDRNDL